LHIWSFDRSQPMIVNWAHAWPSVTAAFLASLVEFVEALTVVLAVGTVRGWRGAFAGSGAALLLLLLIVVILGPALTQIPLGLIQLVVGILLLLFGMRWLRKAILRAAGVIPLHDENAAFAAQAEALRGGSRERGLDRIAVLTAFKITMLEGIEVVFIVVAVGSAGAGLLIPASVGALAALLVVVLFGMVVHKPISTMPENTLKFIVGVLLSAFGCFWFGEGVGIAWPGGDWSLLGLIAAFLITALIGVSLSRQHPSPGAA
jgi:Ca2+/H+ antiporter, TMEM165/GDT1 family